MRIVPIKLWKLGLDLIDVATGGLEFLSTADHGTNVGGALSSREIERACLGIAEGIVDRGAASRWAFVAGCWHFSSTRLFFYSFLRDDTVE